MIQAKQSPQQYSYNKQTRAFFFSFVTIHRPFPSFWNKNYESIQKCFLVWRGFISSPFTTATPLAIQDALLHTTRVPPPKANRSFFARQFRCSLAVVVDLFGCKLMFLFIPCSLFVLPEASFSEGLMNSGMIFVIFFFRTIKPQSKNTNERRRREWQKQSIPEFMLRRSSHVLCCERAKIII